MKFDFPRKRNKVGVTVMVNTIITEKVKMIAENNDSTIIGVYETLITEAIEDYEDKNGKLFTVVEVEEAIKPEIAKSPVMMVDVNYDNKFMTNKKEKKPPQSFCQNANCPDKGKSFNKADMIEVMDFLVCTNDCAEIIKGSRVPAYS